MNWETFDGDLRQFISAASAALDLPPMLTRRSSGRKALGPLHGGAPRIHVRPAGRTVQFALTSDLKSTNCKPAIRASVAEGRAAANAKNKAPKSPACGSNRLT
jgi:hypothetical protein